MPVHGGRFQDGTPRMIERSISIEDEDRMLGASALRVREVVLEGMLNTATAAVLFALIMPSGAAAEPRVLGGAELDTVTASGVFVNVDSSAAALGDHARAFTDARTLTIPGIWFDLGVGLTFGHGLACCAEAADVAVGSTAVGAGDLVHRGARESRSDDGILVHGLSAAFVVAVSFKPPLLPDNLRPALPAARTPVPDAGGN